VISGGGGVILKGNGFYTTDYRSEAYKKEARADDSGSGTKSGADSPSGSKSGSESGKGGKKNTD
jgi:predicted nucleic acid-binding Zn ribbon protein